MSTQYAEITRSPGTFYGAFGAHVVYGTLYKDQSGKRIWLLNLTREWSEDRESSNGHYWISGTEFRMALGGDLFASTYSVGEVVVDLAPDERRAAIEAIDTWEGRPVAA